MHKRQYGKKWTMVYKENLCKHKHHHRTFHFKMIHFYRSGNGQGQPSDQQYISYRSSKYKLMATFKKWTQLQMTSTQFSRYTG